MFPVPCSVVAVISFQPSTSNPAPAREYRTGRLGTSSCPSFPACPGHPWGISKHQSNICEHRALQPSILGAPTWVCEQSQLPCDDYLYRCAMQKPGFELAIAYPIFAGSPCHCPHCGLSLGLFPSRGARVPFLIVLRVTAC